MIVNVSVKETFMGQHHVLVCLLCPCVEVSGSVVKGMSFTQYFGRELHILVVYIYAD